MKLSKQNIIYSILIVLVAGYMVNDLLPKNQSPKVGTSTTGTVVQPTQIEAPAIKNADKVEVINFHGTQRCVSCSKLGELSEKTVKERFSDEIADGKITFKSVNVDLPNNKEVVELYQASGSSLYINAIKDGKNNIVQNVKVWQLIGDEAAFTTYLETQVRSLL